MLNSAIKDAVGLILDKKSNHLVVAEPEGIKDGQFPYFFAIKPELTALKEGVNLEHIIQLTLSAFDQFDVTVGGVIAWDGIYARKNQFVKNNWSLLNTLSNKGLSFLNQGDQSSLRKEYPNVPILGGHEFLNIEPKVSAYALDIICRSTEVNKHGAGFYSNLINLNGQDACLLNAFHPYQEDWFTRADNVMIGFEIYSNRPLSQLRNDMMGTVFPEDCGPGTLKGQVFQNQKILGLKRVCIARNGFHLSPNCIETALGLNSLFSDFAKITPFDDSSADDLYDIVEQLKQTGMNAFDLIEDLDRKQMVNKARELIDV